MILQRSTVLENDFGVPSIFPIFENLPYIPTDVN